VSCDVPDDINLVIEEFKDKFPNLDTSLMPRDNEGKLDELWFLEGL